MLIKYLKLKYGNPDELMPSEYKEKLKGRKGIIVFEVSGWSDATGHADLWDGNKWVVSIASDMPTQHTSWSMD